MINGYHSIADINAIAYVKLKDHLPSRSMWKGSVSFGLVNTPGGCCLIRFNQM
jgi:hypothetical protein